MNPAFSFDLGMRDCRERYYDAKDCQITDVMLGSYSAEFDKAAQESSSQ